MWRLFMSEGARHEGYRKTVTKLAKGGVVLAERDASGKFIKGNKSGGRPKLQPDDRERIRDLGRKGLAKLEELMNDPSVDAAVQARVAIFCTEKAYGKAKQEIENSSARTGMTDSIIEAVKRIE